MGLPGFTAEASLYKTNQHYEGAGSFAQANGVIYPAQVCRPVAGSVQEERFIACMIQCRGGGGTYSGCYRTCCREVTGSYCCYIA
jgi:hypothetical protein